MGFCLVFGLCVNKGTYKLVIAILVRSCSSLKRIVYACLSIKNVNKYLYWFMFLEDEWMFFFPIHTLSYVRMDAMQDRVRSESDSKFETK